MPLLDRIGQQTPASSPAADLARHLQRLLNTRQGTVPQDPRMGLVRLPSLSLQGDPDLLQQLADTLLQQIQRYEPRLQDARLSLQQGQLLLQGRLAGNSKTSVQFLLQPDDNNFLKVEALSHV